MEKFVKIPTASGFYHDLIKDNGGREIKMAWHHLNDMPEQLIYKFFDAIKWVVWVEEDYENKMSLFRCIHPTFEKKESLEETEIIASVEDNELIFRMKHTGEIWNGK